MKKPIDNSGKPTPIKKSKLDPLSDSNESNSIIDGADKFVLFPLDIQETNSISTNPITQNKSTSQEDDFILFPLDKNPSSNSINKTTQASSSSSNKINQKNTKNNTPKPQPVTSAVPPNPPTPTPPVLKKTQLYWAVFFGFCGYAWVKSEKYYILGIISIVVSCYFVISYFYLRAKLSNKLINWVVFFSLCLFGTYAASNYISEKISRQLNVNDSTEDSLLDSVNFMWDSSRRRMSVKDYVSEKFFKLGYFVTDVSRVSRGNYIVKCVNSDSINIGSVYSLSVDVFLDDGNFQINDKIKDFKGTEASRISTISSFISNFNEGGTTVLYVKRLKVDSLLNKYEYEVPITFMSISGTNRLYWIYTVEFINGEIVGMSPEVIDRNKYNQLAKKNKSKIKKKEVERGAVVLPVEEKAAVVIEEKADVFIKEKVVEPFLIVEEMPEFPGGPGEMLKYFSKNTQYPQIAREAGISGKCFYSFVIAPSGEITDVRLSKGVPGCDECDEEAARVIKSMPNWKPGKEAGKVVPVRVTVPFNFSLKKNNTNIKKLFVRILKKKS